MRSSVISCGIIFELPIVIYFLTKLGVVNPDFMRKYRKHAVIVVLIIAAVITPPDVTSQIIVSIPIMLLYEVSISFFTDNPALHFVVSQLNCRHCPFSRYLAAHPLHSSY